MHQKGEACTRTDCGKCRTCLDMPKFGGQGKMRKKCLLRSCSFMVQAAGGDGAPAKKRHAPEAAKATKASRGTDDSSDGSETDDEDDDLDHVACCLTKCSVDFSDEFFFEPLPDDGDEEESESDEDSQMTKSSKARATEDESSIGIGDKPAAAKPSGKEGPGGEPTAAAAPANNAVTEESEHGDSGDDAKTSGQISDKDLKVAAEPAEDLDTKPPAEEEEQEEDSDGSEERPPFQLPRRFHDPNNALMLCDGPMHATKSRVKGEGYKCDRAYLQKSHFVPVLSIPRGQWRCLVCRYRDEQYVGGDGASAEGDGEDSSAEEVATKGMTDEELNAIFRCIPESPTENGDDKPAGSDNRYSAEEILALEQKFELVSAPLKARLLKEELTTKSRKVIKAALSAMRLAEHSLRSFTETSRARKALTERIESLGMPQEMYQVIHKIASSKMKILNLVSTLEQIIRCRPPRALDGPSSDGGEVPLSMVVDRAPRPANKNADPIDRLMDWYNSQPSETKGRDLDGKSLLHHMFPEGSLKRRRCEPRTDEGDDGLDSSGLEEEPAEDDNDSSSGISLDNLRCHACMSNQASESNDMLLCDGIGCHRAFHMECLHPKVTPEEVAKSGDDDDWFCPLCTAHATLIHYAQSEYFGHDESHDLDDWENAVDVFPEAEMELRVAKKFKDGKRDEETEAYTKETLGIGRGVHKQRPEHEASSLDIEEEDSEEDEDFDHEDAEVDDESLADDMDLEVKLAKEKIKRDEIDALSVSSIGGEDSDDDSSSDDEDGGGDKPRRSKRRRFELPEKSSGDSEDSDDRSELRDVGKLDTANIVRGKRRRAKVDYQK